MTLQELRDSGRIIYEVISGSHAYGTNVETSDQDLRGFFWTPKDCYISLFNVQDQINDEKNDIVYYDLRRAFDLLKTANPNIIELLWIPQDCIRVMKKPIMEIMFANRKLFISKRAYFTHAAYAAAQIKKASGSNKKVHNPCSKEMPKKEDFCGVILSEHFNGIRREDIDSSIFPMRPQLLEKTKIDLSKYHVAALEHVSNTYRLYEYGEKARGVFRGNDMLVCESIPIDDEWENFRGLLIYNQTEFERAVKNWHSYWDWVSSRNESRWIDQEKGLLTYDQKNLCHCVRLMISAEHILTEGEPLVRFEGKMKEHLMRIRRGEFTYEEIMKDVEEREIRLKNLYETSPLQHEVDMEKLDKLYKMLMETRWENVHE